MDCHSLDQIIFLLTDDNFKAELKTFRRSFQRFKIRFRNSKLSAELKQVKTLIRKLEVDFPPAFFELHREKSKPKLLNRFESQLLKLINSIDRLLDKATLVYGISQAHFRVGHLVQHYLVIRASLARIIFCYRALLVYSVDLYSSLAPEARKAEVSSILIKHGCKPKPAKELNSPEIIEPELIIGEIIDRKTMRPVRKCKKT